MKALDIGQSLHRMDALVFQGWPMKLLRTCRAAVLLACFSVLTLPLMLLQAAFLKLGARQARVLPHLYHKAVLRLLGVRVHVAGRPDRDHPILFVSNHVSWLDIPVLSALAPLSFVSKAEVASWPFVSVLAKLQRSVFIDRTRRTLVKDKAGEIAERLAQGDNVVLFAEGTSSDGNRILPFRTSLFSAAALAPLPARPAAGAVVQTVTISYTHLHGLPLLRHERPLVAWYGEMDMLSHVWNVLKSGPLDVRVRIGEPAELSGLPNRKDLAAFSESRVRDDYVKQLTARTRAA